MDFLINSAYAQAAGGGPQGMIGTLALPVLLAAGDEVATSGGILGKVVDVGDQFVALEIASDVTIKIQKFQIAQVLPKGTVKNA